MKLDLESDVVSNAPRMLTTSITSYSDSKQPQAASSLTRTQGVYQVSSQRRQYFRYVVTLGHDIEQSIHIRGGNITNPKAIGRADQVRRWIRQGRSPETIAPMIRQWR